LIGGRSLVLVDTDGDHDADRRHHASSELHEV
jgi:hypothetical protein